MSVSLLLSERQFRELLQQVLPKLGQRQPKLYRLTKGKEPQLLDARTPQELKDSQYQGVILVSTADSITYSPAQRAQRPQALLPAPDAIPEAEPASPPVTSFNQALDLTRESLQGIQQVLVRREDILTTAESLYSDNSILACEKLFVQFEGEDGVDVDGVSRDFFSSYWRRALSECTAGHHQLYLQMLPGLVSRFSKERLEAMSRILLHGFLVCGFLPINLNNASLFFILSGHLPSNTYFKECFLNCVEERIRGLFDQSENLSENAQHELILFFTQHHCSALPTSRTIGTLLDEVSTYRGYYNPYFILTGLQHLMSNELFSKMTEDDFKALLESMRPDGKEIAMLLDPDYSDDVSKRVCEEDVFEFLLQFVRELDRERAAIFVRFVTGMETIRTDLRIRVSFNGLVGYSWAVAPTSNTCSDNLHVTRYFGTFQELKVSFMLVLSNQDAWSRLDVA